MALTRDFKEPFKRECNAIQNFAKTSLPKPPGAFLLAMLKPEKPSFATTSATVGFEKLAAVHKSPKSLMRMFGEKRNPQAQNLFSVFSYIQKKEKIKLAVHSQPA